MNKSKEIQLHINPKCTSFGFIVKRKICAAFIPFVIMLALHTVVQMVLFWTTKTQTPFLTAPLFMFLFFMYCSPVFNHGIEDKYGVTRTQNFLTSYTVAALYSLVVVLFALGLAELCHYSLYSHSYDASLFLLPRERVENFFYGLVTCLLMYPLSDVFFRFRHSGHLFFTILCGVLMFAIPLVCTGMASGAFFEYSVYFFERTYALIAFVICFVAISGLDFILLKRGIR